MTNGGAAVLELRYRRMRAAFLARTKAAERLRLTCALQGADYPAGAAAALTILQRRDGRSRKRERFAAPPTTRP